MDPAGVESELFGANRKAADGVSVIRCLPVDLR